MTLLINAPMPPYFQTSGELYRLDSVTLCASTWLDLAAQGQAGILDCTQTNPMH